VSFVGNTSRPLEAPEWLILTGALAFIAVLTASAYWDPSIRWLHFFQAWMYLATIVLSLRGSRWGHFVGVSVAAFWDYTSLFVNTFFYNGLQQLEIWTHTGHVERPDILIAVPAWLSNLLVICGCLWAYARLPEKRSSDFARFLLAFTTGFFALDIALVQPRYLGLFPHLLHPRIPW
jgi:hypothetical protein